ncbi:TPA: DUF1642 domain-containing protein [Streptococcus suis]|nr:DUF1642 domain-containing protein [Streptococcus suis]
MNKQELEKQAEALYADVRSFLDNTFELIDQIYEPQKVVVPAFIDSFIRYTKAEGMSLFIAMDNAQNKESEWIITNEDTFARAWLDGYEIEQEKLYAVKLVGTGQYLVERYKRQGFVFIDTKDPLLFTKSELESAGFGGVFDSPLFEVEEVER